MPFSELHVLRREGVIVDLPVNSQIEQAALLAGKESPLMDGLLAIGLEFRASEHSHSGMNRTSRF